MLLARKRSEECPFCQYWPQSRDSRTTALPPVRSPAANPLQEQTVEEAAMPGQP